MKRKKEKLKSDVQLLNDGLKALYAALGPVEAHAFMGLVSHRKTDYVKISRKLYRGQTLDEICERAKAVKL